jgi:hypothetical protein
MDGLRKCSKNDFMCHPTPCTMRPIWHRNTTTVSEMVPSVVVGLPSQSSGFKGKTSLRVRATQSNQSKGRSNTKDGQHFGAPGAP